MCDNLAIEIEKLLISIREKYCFEDLRKNYQQFRVTDDRNIILTFSGTEAHYEWNFRRVHIDLGVSFKYYF